MQTNNKMAVAPIGKLIWQMSIPPLISMFLQYSYNLIDSAFVAQLSENALTAVYPHRSDDSGRGNRLTHHRGRVYRLGGFCYIFRRIGGTWERNSLLTDFPLPVCSGHHPGCVFTQQVFRSGWRLECVLDHGSDYCDHFPCHLPQGNHRPVTAARKP